MGVGLRILIITLLLLLSINLAFPQLTWDYCFETNWNPVTGCIGITESPSPATPDDTIRVLFRYRNSDCFFGGADSAKLAGNVFTIFGVWRGYPPGQACPEVPEGHKAYTLGKVLGDSLVVRVLYYVFNTQTQERIEGIPFEKTFYLRTFPTLSEFGLLIFALLLLSLIFWYLHKHRTRATCT
jgi:hypothetical protein